MKYRKPNHTADFFRFLHYAVASLLLTSTGILLSFLERNGADDGMLVLTAGGALAFGGLFFLLLHDIRKS